MLKFSLKFQINVIGKIIGYLRSSAKLNDTAGQNNGNNGLKKVPVAILQISASVLMNLVHVSMQSHLLKQFSSWI